VECPATAISAPKSANGRAKKRRLGARAPDISPGWDPEPSLGREKRNPDDFSYPDADKIASERDIVLTRGDGHVLLGDCRTGTDLIEVWSVVKDTQCFTSKGASGWLTLDQPRPYLIRGNSRRFEATLLANGQTQAVDVPVNTWTPVGEGTSPDSSPASLIELKIAE
jgi:hypothetical protein